MSPTTSGRPRTRPATPRRLRTVTEYSFRGLFTLEGNLFRGITDQGFEAWPVEGSTGAPDYQSQGLHGCAIQATLERGVRDILRSVQSQSRVPSRGIPSRESIEPSDPIEWVRAPPSEPLRALLRDVFTDHEPTLIERGMDVRLNHRLTTHRSNHGSWPGHG